jgi:hypothetical protein
MKPGILKWATNNNFAAGPDVGSATKVPPTSGQEADGYYRNNKPAAQIWNYNRWGALEKINQFEIAAVKNWTEASNKILTASGPPAPDKAGFFDTYQNIHTVVEFSGGANHAEVRSSNGGRYLTLLATAIPNAASNESDGFATGTDTRVLCYGLVADYIYYSTALGAWTLWTGLGATGKLFAKGDFYNGRYCFLDTLVDIFSTTSTGTVPAVVDTQLTGTYCSLKHSKHVAGTLYPNDPGNLTWMAVTSTQSSVSSDGVTWGTPAAHGLTGIDSECWMDYSAHGSRWIIATKGITGGLGTIAISDDNGATWTAYNRLPYYRITAGITGVKIASDGFGTWVVAAADVGSNEVDTVYSVDNGETWEPMHLPYDGKQNARVALWYGDGQFNLAIEDNTPSDYRQFHSMTLEP